MSDTEKEYIDDLIRYTEESIRFFSNDMKPARERSVCAAFLRCIGIKFSTKDIIPQDNDPPDVTFESANFEIRELYEEGRKRQDEYKERRDELKQANTINDTLVPIQSPVPITYQQIFAGIKPALSNKANRYGMKLCSSLDALVYVSLPGRFLDKSSKLPEYSEIMAQCWRSVSFVIPPYAHVIYCEENGPCFLFDCAGKTRMEWKNPDTFFDL